MNLHKTQIQCTYRLKTIHLSLAYKSIYLSAHKTTASYICQRSVQHQTHINHMLPAGCRHMAFCAPRQEVGSCYAVHIYVKCITTETEIHHSLILFDKHMPNVNLRRFAFRSRILSILKRFAYIEMTHLN